MQKPYLSLFRLYFGCMLLISSCLDANTTPIWDPIPIHEAFISKSGGSQSIVATREPPPSIAEKVPPRPAKDLTWIRGYWAWVADQNDFAWVCGVWRRPPPNHIWIYGDWINQGDVWAWAAGFWSSMPLNGLVYVDDEPPKSVDDRIPPSLGEDFFWIPGYWEYSNTSQRFEWLSGKWQRFNPDWILTPTTYVWKPSGYVYVPLYWDWPLESRGFVFSCSTPGTSRLAIIEPSNVIRRLFIYYPDYATLFWHWWHFHPGWWEGCGCIPPWWYWSSWWTCPWNDLWGLWWWWGNPGSLPPAWITLEFSLKIPPPKMEMVEFFKKIKKPQFSVELGHQPLSPEGASFRKEIPRPHIPDGVMPRGQVAVPALPNRQVLPLSPPPMPQQPEYPQEPEYSEEPQDYIPGGYQVIYPALPYYPYPSYRYPGRPMRQLPYRLSPQNVLRQEQRQTHRSERSTQHPDRPSRQQSIQMPSQYPRNLPSLYHPPQSSQRQDQK